ncbi:hypothetical protein BV898_09603 [Hypsibius exemplaris]|uniref:Carbohydrate kinase PfkB domain-containing protein n=1 Tax=Hypsibius exemplaris TaxID=2072580 RepID=A0A1W0WM68_HYPEX|nr:hypothetical protein BV898_09603 [Hypsibius exemplaris]
MNGATYSGELFMSCGGVGRNIADCLTRLGSDPILLSAIGQDASAQVVKKHCTHMDLSYLLELPQSATSGYVGLLSEEGQLRAGVMNMDIHSQITADYVSKYEKEIKESSMVVIDGNLSAETIDHVLALAGRYNVPGNAALP